MRDRAQNMFAIFPLKFDLYVYFGQKQILDVINLNDHKLEVKFQKFLEVQIPRKIDCKFRSVFFLLRFLTFLDYISQGNLLKTLAKNVLIET
jgi:hypothetical protein